MSWNVHQFGECYSGSDWSKIWNVFQRFSYIDEMLMKYLISDKFRRNWIYNGEKLVQAGDKFWSRNQLKFSEDKECPDPKYRQKYNISCPTVACSLSNCFCKCVLDNCNRFPDGPPGPPPITAFARKGALASGLPVYDPFNGVRGFQTNGDGMVRNMGGGWSRYKESTNGKFKLFIRLLSVFF